FDVIRNEKIRPGKRLSDKVSVAAVFLGDLLQYAEEFISSGNSDVFQQLLLVCKDHSQQHEEEPTRLDIVVLELIGDRVD
ncbi:hypothetical protein PMAYCL1PPCAC_08869, partial [Pristionchus mayeri]